jgi:hypothetical protein
MPSHADTASRLRGRAERTDGGAGTSTATRGLHIGFAAPSRDHVHRFWQAETEAGYRDDAAPGPRLEYSDDCYRGFLLDPDGSFETSETSLVESGGCAPCSPGHHAT